MGFHQIISVDPLSQVSQKRQLCAQSYYDECYTKPGQSHK